MGNANYFKYLRIKDWLTALWRKGVIVNNDIENLKAVLVNIAGNNAISSNCDDIQKLTKSINYLVTQMRITISDTDSDDIVRMTDALADACAGVTSILSR